MDTELKQEKLLHYTMSFIGGIFAIYSLLEHANVFGSAETSNMILLVNDLLNWDIFHIAIRIGSLFIYASGIITTLWMTKHYPDMQKRVCMIIDCLAALILAFLPENIHPVVALYPVAFAMSIQWCTFRGVGKNPSATTFSTGNFRQLITLTFNYATEKKIGEFTTYPFLYHYHAVFSCRYSNHLHPLASLGTYKYLACIHSSYCRFYSGNNTRHQKKFSSSALTAKFWL